MGDIVGSPGSDDVLAWHITKHEVRELLASLNHYCFHAGAERFANEFALSGDPSELAVTHPDAMPDYLRCLNWSLKEAQQRIIDARLRLETTRRADLLEIDAPFTFGYLIRLLTDYADSIAWGLLLGDQSWVRSQFLEPKSHSDLKDHNWESIETVLAEFNKDPDRFALANDLTSFMHVGDLFLRDIALGEAMAIEVKSGSANDRVLEILSSENEESFKDRLTEFVTRSPNPKHAFKQVERNLKQHERAARSQRYRLSNNAQRIDLKTGSIVHVNESEFAEDWSDLVRESARDLGAIDAADGVIRGCLFFEYGTGPRAPDRDQFFRYRLSRRLELSLDQRDLERLPIFDFAQILALPCFVPQTTNLLKLGENRQVRLLGLEDHLLVYLDVPRLTEMLAEHGVLLEVRKVKREEHAYLDPVTQAVFGPNRLPHISLSGPNTSGSIIVLGGVTSRILFNFLSPMILVDMLLNSAE
jgi:hypothetical protein